MPETKFRELGLKSVAQTRSPTNRHSYSVFYAVFHFCLFLCWPLTHAHTGNPNQGPKWSPSNNAHDPREDRGSGTGRPESLCVIQTHKVPINLTSRLVTLVRFLQFSTQLCSIEKRGHYRWYTKWLHKHLADSFLRVLKNYFQFLDP